MPRISFFYGIIIRMYWNERDHPVPHFHAEYGDHVASIDMNGDMLAGTLPPARFETGPRMGAAA